MTFIGGLTSTTTYNYDHANRLTSVNGVNYTWDDNGNLLNDGVNTYTYDSANRLKTLTNATTTATYSHNGFGDRLQETVNGVTTTFTMDLNTGLTQALSDGTNTYIYGNGRIAQAAGGGIEYFLGDALGSVCQLTNQSGAITYAKAYDPYGVVTSTSGASQSAYGYTSEFTSNDLVYLRARHYAPGMGRFLTRDTWMGDYNRPLALNRWMYVEGNPINFTDPTGLCTATGDNWCFESEDPRNLTSWLFREMTINANDPVVQRMRMMNRLAKSLVGLGIITCDVFLIPIPAMPSIFGPAVPLAGATALHAGALYTFREQVKNGARWDFKDEIGIQLGQGVTYCGIGMCYDDIEYSVAGNIFYGYIGRASGFPWWEIKGGAAWAEQNDPSHDPNSPEYVPDAPLGEGDWSSSDPVAWNFGDEMHDNAAVTLGIKLWDNHGANLSLSQFMSELNSFVGQLQHHAQSDRPVQEQYAKYWPYSVGHFNNIGRVYVPGQP